MGYERNTTAKGNIRCHLEIIIMIDSLLKVMDILFMCRFSMHTQAEGGIDSARREAVLLSRMKHPNIVAFRESFEGLYLVHGLVLNVLAC